MLTEGVEDASTAMYELKFMFGLKGTLPQFPAAGRGFQNTPCPAVRILSMPSYYRRIFADVIVNIFAH